ncbi:MAG: ComF family protein [Lachnospiraceae bacterium]|nr:ComF family protein [Lachnospiraceae bacterium]
MYKEIWNYIYPRRCPVCMDILEEQKTMVCPACFKKIKQVRQPYCFKCGKPLLNERQEYCYDCERRAHIFDRGFSLVEYDAVTSPSIMAIKYKNKREFVEFYSRLSKILYQDILSSQRFDAIIPVPVSRKKRRIRGYNQARIFADGISGWLHVPVKENLLLRKKDTAPLKKLTPEDRRKELLECFSWEKKHYEGERSVLLVDDIYTSGATADACALILKKHGIKKVFLLTIAIGRGI